MTIRYKIKLNTLKYDLASDRIDDLLISQSLAAVEKMVRRAPRKEGLLRSAIGSTPLRRANGIKTITVGVLEPVSYAEERHEVEAAHYTEPNTGTKYVEGPAKDLAENIREGILRILMHTL